MKTRCALLLIPALPFTAAAAVRTWDGGGGNALFSTAANWSPDGVPASGDDLVLGAAAPAAVTNDLSGRSFASLLIQRPLTLGGNAFTLTAGLSSVPANTGGPVLIDTDITLGASQTVTSGGGVLSSLTFAGNLVFGANVLTLAGGRAVTFSGITGSALAGSGLQRTGTGLLRLAPSGIFLSPQTVTWTTGTLDVDGIFQAPLVLTGGTLTGEGSLSAGLDASAGQIVPDAGDLSVSGTTLLRGNVNLRVALLGPSDETRLECSALTIQQQAALEVDSTGYLPVRGDGFQVIGKSTAGVISGTFINVAESSEITAGSSILRASYLGGNGNDLFLTTISTTRTWDGGTVINDNWDEADNWSGNIPARAGDTLVFPPGIDATDRGVDNNFPNDTTFRRLVFSGDDFTVRGNPFRLSHGLTVASGITTHLDTDVTLAADQTFLIGGRLELDLLDRIQTAGHQLRLDGNGELSGRIDGSGSLFIGDGDVPTASITTRQAHTYSGTTTIETGTRLTLEKPTAFDPDPALGTTAAGTEVRGTLILDNGASVGTFDLAEALTLDGGTVESYAFDSPLGGTDGLNRLSGPISLRAGTFSNIITYREGLGPGGRLDISGTISGSGTLRLTLDGNNNNETTISGSAANSFTGNLTVDDGLLILEKASPGMLAVSGAQLGILATGNTVTHVETREDEQIADTCALNLVGRGRLSIGNITARTETIGSLRFTTSASEVTGSQISGAADSLFILNGTVLHTGPRPGEVAVRTRFTRQDQIVDVAEERCLFSRPVTGLPSASVQKTGAGTLEFSSAVSVPVTVTAGRLTYTDNAEGDGAASAVLLAGGEVGGSGRCGSITSSPAGGTIRSSVQIRNFRTGSLSLNGATTVQRRILSAAAGSGFDQLIVTGTITLGNAALQLLLEPGLSVATGSQLPLLVNDGTDPVTGTFQNLPEGAYIPIPAASGGGGWIISYAGGSGNDVSITRVAASEADTVPVLTGLFLSSADQNGNRPGSVTGRGAPGVNYRLESSTDLISWQSSAPAQAGAPATGALSFSITASPPVRPKEFFRIRRL